MKSLFEGLFSLRTVVPLKPLFLSPSLRRVTESPGFVQKERKRDARRHVRIGFCWNYRTLFQWPTETFLLKQEALGREGKAEEELKRAGSH